VIAGGFPGVLLKFLGLSELSFPFSFLFFFFFYPSFRFPFFLSLFNWNVATGTERPQSGGSSFLSFFFAFWFFPFLLALYSALGIIAVSFWGEPHSLFLPSSSFFFLVLSPFMTVIVLLA